MELTKEPDVIKNDRLCEAISVVLQELHTIIEERRRNRELKDRSSSPCPCGECP
jgi:hypothetical protein